MCFFIHDILMCDCMCMYMCRCATPMCYYGMCYHCGKGFYLHLSVCTGTYTATLSAVVMKLS